MKLSRLPARYTVLPTVHRGCRIYTAVEAINADHNIMGRIRAQITANQSTGLNQKYSASELS